MTDDKTLISAIEAHEAAAQTYGSLQEDRADALDYYLGKPLGNEVEGRSQVINRTVWDTVEWLKPQLADVFCSGEDLVSFAPRMPDDVKASEQETDYVNYVITQRNDWFTVFYGWSHDALIQKNGYVKVYWDNAEDQTVERYEGLTQDEYSLILQDKDITIVEVQEQAGQDMMGMPAVFYTCKVERAKPRNVVRIDNIAPEHVRVDQNARSLSLQDPRVSFVQHAERKTLSELRAEGFDVEDDIADSGEGVGDWEENFRDDYAPFRDRDGEESDPSMRRVKVRETWIRHDKDGDGKAELLHVILVGTTVLHCEETDHVPIIALCPAPLAHTHYGLSIADAVMDLQRIQTALLRGALDNQYLANNGRFGVNLNTVNLDDMLDSRAGGLVRVDGEPGGAFFPLTHPTNGQVAIPMLEYVEKIAQRRTGISEMSQGLDPNALNNAAGAQANMAMLTAAQQRIKFIARVFAETGIKALFQIVHSLTLKHSRQQEMVRLRGEWVPIDPRTWVKRQDVQISMTLGTGDKPAQIAMLQQIALAQREGLALGLAKPKNLFNTAVRLTKLLGYKDASEFFTDPGDEPLQPPQDPKLAIAQMQSQSDIQRFQAEAQLKQQTEMLQAEAKQREIQLQLELQAANDMRDSERETLKAQLSAELEQVKVQSAQQIASLEDATKRYVAELNSQTAIAIEEMRLGQKREEVQTNQQVTLTTAQMSAQQRAEEQAQKQAEQAKPKEKPEPKPRDNSDALGAGLLAVAKALENSTRPKRIVRGPDGRAEGIE